MQRGDLQLGIFEPTGLDISVASHPFDGLVPACVAQQTGTGTIWIFGEFGADGVTIRRAAVTDDGATYTAHTSFVISERVDDPEYTRILEGRIDEDGTTRLVVRTERKEGRGRWFLYVFTNDAFDKSYELQYDCAAEDFCDNILRIDDTAVLCFSARYMDSFWPAWPSYRSRPAGIVYFSSDLSERRATVQFPPSVSIGRYFGIEEENPEGVGYPYSVCLSQDSSTLFLLIQRHPGCTTSSCLYVHNNGIELEQILLVVDAATGSVSKSIGVGTGLFDLMYSRCIYVNESGRVCILSQHKLRIVDPATGTYSCTDTRGKIPSEPKLVGRTSSGHMCICTVTEKSLTYYTVR